MTYTHREAVGVFRNVRKELLLVVLLCTLAAIILGFARGSHRSAFESAEVKFTDSSAHGMAIVPASCPSNPHPGESCSPTTSATNDNCVLTASNYNPTPGQQTTLYWLTTAGYTKSFAPDPGGMTRTFVGASIDRGVGVVNDNQGSLAITPDISPTSAGTLYTYSATYCQIWDDAIHHSDSCAGTGEADPTYATPVYTCTVLLHVNCPAGQYGFGAGCVTSCPVGYVPNSNNICVFSSCPTGYTLQGNACVNVCANVCSGSNIVNSCTSALVQTCPFGCSGGVCLSSALPAGNLTATPLLVRQGDTTRVTWNAQNVTSCTVVSTNGDVWTGTASSKTSRPITSQATYTLTCLSGVTKLIQTVIVNIIPKFCEPGAPNCGQ